LVGRDAVQDGVVGGVEGPGGRIAWRRRHHALQSDRVRIAPHFLGMAPNGLDRLAAGDGAFDTARQPAISISPDPAIRGLRITAYPDRQPAALRRLPLHGPLHPPLVPPAPADPCLPPA